jgi:hypothetical protein
VSAASMGVLKEQLVGFGPHDVPGMAVRTASGDEVGVWVAELVTPESLPVGQGHLQASG